MHPFSASSVLLLLALACGAGALAQEAAPDEQQRLEYVHRARVRETVDVAGMDLYRGPAGRLAFAVDEEVGCDFQPQPLSGWSEKFACRLADGSTVKVKYEAGGKYKEVFGEVLGTRLFWALGFHADRMLPVRLSCRGCPEHPWEYVDERKKLPLDQHGNIASFPPDANIGSWRFELAAIEEPLDGRTIETRDKQGWRWDLLEQVDATLGGATRADIDAFRLLNAFVQNADNKSRQNKLVCPRAALDAGSDAKVSCSRPILYVSDLGSVFGNGGFTTGGSGRVDYEGWKARRVWRDKKACRARLAAIGGAFKNSTLRDPVIGEAGRQLLSSLLAQLSDAQIADLFRAARIERLHQRRDGGREVSIEDWVQLFKDKRSEITEHPGCPSPLEPGSEDFPPEVPTTFGAAKTLFDPVGFHRIDLVVDDADWAAYLAEGTRKLHGGNSIAATASIDGTAFGRIGIRPFGFGSRNHNENKPNIRMSFDEFLQGNRGPQGAKVLRLKASGQDPTWLRQPFSQALVQAVGGHAPRFSWARVSVNGEPYGLYQLFEQVDKHMFERKFGNSDGHNYERKESCFGLNCPKGGCAELASKYEGKGDASEIVKLAQTAHTGAPGWFEDASRIADMDSLLAQYAVEAWESDIDSLAAAGQNFELYVDQRTGLLEFIPVGMDKGFGTWRNDAWYELATPWGKPNSWCKGRVDEFYRRIWSTPVAREALLRKIKALHCGPMSNAVLLPLIDRYQALLGEDLHHDPKGAPVDTDAAYLQLKDYVSRRNSYLDAELGSCP